jgi:hypothetical protein
MSDKSEVVSKRHTVETASFFCLNGKKEGVLGYFSMNGE